MLEAGASGFLPKGSCREIVVAINAVAGDKPHSLMSKDGGLGATWAGQRRHEVE